MNHIGFSVVAGLLALAALATVAAFPVGRAESFPVEIVVDAGQRQGEFREIWRYFGADEPNYATMTNGRKLLGELGALRPKKVFFRTHNLLTSGDGKPALKWGSTNVYTEKPDGTPVYDWRILDEIFDTYLKQGVRPYAQIGFMPEALSTKPVPYRHHWTPAAKYDEIYTGWTYPPKDYGKWSELCYQWAKHCVDRYGRKEVETWFWETWNEPNIGYWHGTREEFMKLHDTAVAGVRRAIPKAKVGGADIAGGGSYFRAFIEHCIASGTPMDFLSFHAKGSPTYVDGHVRMGISAQLRTIDENFGLVASFPSAKSLPIVIGESDPEGCAACQGPQLGYRNGTMYSSYTAASFARKMDLATKHGVNLEGALTWAFTFEDQPYFAGFRQLMSQGIDLPVLNVFRMYSKMGGERVSATSSAAVPLAEIVKSGVRGAPDVSALASLKGKRLAVMVWHYHDDDVAGPLAAVTLRLKGLAGSSVRVTEYRIDSSHSNSYAVWQGMGSPAQPTDEQIRELEKAGGLAKMGSRPALRVEDGEASLAVELPRQAVALFVVE
jgi:xylan 1,4-beta-xylosidase